MSTCAAQSGIKLAVPPQPPDAKLFCSRLPLTASPCSLFPPLWTHWPPCCAPETYPQGLPPSPLPLLRYNGRLACPLRSPATFASTWLRTHCPVCSRILSESLHDSICCTEQDIPCPEDAPDREQVCSDHAHPNGHRGCLSQATASSSVKWAHLGHTLGSASTQRHPRVVRGVQASTKSRQGQTWWCILLIPGLRRQRLVDL